MFAIEIKSPYPSRINQLKYEINNLIFTGEKHFKDYELSKIILSRPTELSVPHRGVRYLYEQVSINKYSPLFFVKNLKYGLKYWEDEFRFFKENIAKQDSMRLTTYYHRHGFHQFKCKIKFYGDSNTHKNTLEFVIQAGERWKFGAIIYLGLDSLPSNIKERINQVRTLQKGMPFDEAKLIDEIRQINTILLEEGYFYTKLNRDAPIEMDMEAKENSVVVLFEPGIRQRIASIDFVDSLTTQTPISSNMKRSLLDFKVEQYYNPQKISQSELNLYSLGTFNLVTIDTINSHQNPLDSTLNLRVLLIYRKQHDYHFGLFLNQTTWDQAINLGGEGNYSNKNLFGAAQLFNPFVKATILDIGRLIENWPNFEYEFSAGINFSQPMLWNFPGFKVSFSAQPSYSYRIFNKFLKLETWALPLTFNVNLPEFTFFQNMNIKFSFERQDPRNFTNAMNELSKELSGNRQDTIRLLETFTLYRNLNTYVGKHNPLLTANLIGTALTGDSRNNPFSPTRGYFTNLSIEGLNPVFLPFDKLQGAAKFIRLQAMYLYFKSFSPFSLLAFKLKAGHIYWWDKSESYVPPDKQFFCGGANSVRGWSSRRLRYYNQEQYDFNFGNSKISQNYALDYVGNSTVIEGSFEYRLRFSTSKNIGNIFEEQLSNFGAVFFIDFGNAFQWLIVDTSGKYYYTYKWQDFFTKLAVAAGIGLRYETPVGPLRVDFGWPVYDPMRKEAPFIFSRSGGIRTMVFHIGLGHAF